MKNKYEITHILRTTRQTRCMRGGSGGQCMRFELPCRTSSTQNPMKMMILIIIISSSVGVPLLQPGRISSHVEQPALSRSQHQLKRLARPVADQLARLILHEQWLREREPTSTTATACVDQQRVAGGVDSAVVVLAAVGVGVYARGLGNHSQQRCRQRRSCTKDRAVAGEQLGAHERRLLPRCRAPVGARMTSQHVHCYAAAPPRRLLPVEPWCHGLRLTEPCATQAAQSRE